MKKYSRLLIISAFLIATDQFLKLVFFDNSACNKNIAWGVPIAPGVFYFAWFAIVFFLIYSFSNGKNKFGKISFAFVFSGAISNLIDRMAHGCVVDFIDLKIWPVFNSADVYITIGVIIFVINVITKSKPRSGLPKF